MNRRLQRALMLFAIILLLPAAAGAEVGTKVDEFVLPDQTGASRRLSDWQDRRLLVLVFVDGDCPVARLYAPRLNELAREFGAPGVAFVGVLSGPDVQATQAEQFQRTHELSMPVLVDSGAVLAGRVGALRAPEAFLLDEGRTVRYAGRIDDQYRPGLQRPGTGRRDLAEAIRELLAGQPVSVPRTEAAGCFINRSVAMATAARLTYCRDVAPIVQRRCVGCHRPGQAAPFPLLTYHDLASRSRRVREAVAQGRMPPWHANPAYGHFANDPRLSPSEKQTLFEWIDSGALEGDPRELPAPAALSDDWRIAEPQRVIAMPEAFTLPAEGLVDYQYFEVDPGFSEDQWVQMAELRPGNRAVVHHALVFLRPPGSKELVAQGELQSVWLADFSPGSPPLVLPPGRAKRIPAGWRLVFQLHYVAIGSVQSDRTSLGLVFADPRTVKQEVATNMAADFKLTIPPHSPDTRVEACHAFADDVLLLSLHPHMHLRGKSFRFEAVYPDNEREVLLDVPRYDFNWQNHYVLAEPKRLPRGTTMHCVAHFDNSADNPANPDPSATVVWGEQSKDEMMIGYFDIVRADEDLTSWGAALGRISWTAYARVGIVVAAVLLLWHERRRKTESFRRRP